MRLYISEATTDGSLAFITGHVDGGEPIKPGWHTIVPIDTQILLLAELRRLRRVAADYHTRAEDTSDELVAVRALFDD